MEADLNIHTTCRICLGPNKIMKNLCENGSLLHFFTHLTGLQLNMYDNLYKICESCGTRLESIQEFIGVWKQNHEIIQQHIHKYALQQSFTPVNNEEFIIEQNISNAEFITANNNQDVNTEKCFDKQRKSNYVEDNAINNSSVESFGGDGDVVGNESCTLDNDVNSSENSDCDSSNVLNKDDADVSEMSSSNKNIDDNGVTDESLLNKENTQMRRKITKFPHEQVLSAVDALRKKTGQDVQCIKCGLITSRIRSLLEHMKHLHGDIMNRWCQQCNLEVDHLMEHKKVHLNDIKCVFCEKVFKKKTHLVEHLYCHSDQRSHKCDICKLTFATKISLLRHTHENAKLEENGCKRLKYDAKQDPALCSVCGKQFKTNSKLKIHLRIHFGFTPYKCTYCEKRMSTRSHLVVHERTHTREKPHVCHVCGKGFAQSSVLNTHMRQHTGRPEVCMLCDKRFCRATELKLHMRKHTGEKPFICTECGQSFIQRSHLVDHEKTHKDDRPFQCGICGRGFKQNSCLKSHIKIHLGEKPFKCNQCPYACRQSYSLIQHMKRHSQ